MNFSYWERQFLPLESDLVIIGGGITGLSAAYFASQKFPSWNITVIEKFSTSTAASTRNAGFSCFGSMGELISDLNSGIPEEEVLETVKSRYEGLKLLRKTLGDKHIQYSECGGLELFTSSQTEEYEQVSAQIKSFNEKLAPITGKKNTFSATSVPDQLYGYSNAIFNIAEGKLNSGFMMKVWEEKCRLQNVKIITGHQANVDVESKLVQIKNHEIKAKNIAICTNGLSETLDLKLDVKPVRNLILLTKKLAHLNLNSTYHHDQGYMYFREIDGRILIGGARNYFLEKETTSEFHTNEDLKTHLLAYAERHLKISKSDIEHQWTGIMGVGNSKKPIIKEISGNVFCGIRLGGMGVAIGTQVGKSISEMLY